MKEGDKMIYSMTGYGRCEVERNGHKMNLEISSVNHRYCDINMRLPRSLNPLEEKIRKMLKAAIGRGKVDVSLFYTNMNESDTEVMVNEPVFKAYIEKLRELGEKFDLVDNLGLAEMAGLSDILSVQKKSVDIEKVWQELEKVIEEALSHLLAMREKEGYALQCDLYKKADFVEEVVTKLEAFSPQVVVNYRTKLEERLQKLMDQGSMDASRLAMEVAIFADRAAIDEELTRLKSHVAQLRAILDEGGQVGRKLDFLMQEMNREANTIASKANDYTVTSYAVELKTEIEKMREQIQNIE